MPTRGREGVGRGYRRRRRRTITIITRQKATPIMRIMRINKKYLARV
jgi:hypothetical protein